MFNLESIWKLKLLYVNTLTPPLPPLTEIQSSKPSIDKPHHLKEIAQYYQTDFIADGVRTWISSTTYLFQKYKERQHYNWQKAANFSDAEISTQTFQWELQTVGTREMRTHHGCLRAKPSRVGRQTPVWNLPTLQSKIFSLQQHWHCGKPWEMPTSGKSHMKRACRKAHCMVLKGPVPTLEQGGAGERALLMFHLLVHFNPVGQKQYNLLI